MVPFGSLTIVDAPTNLGLAPLLPGHQPGTRKGPDALRELGLHRVLSPTRQYRVEAEPYADDEARLGNIRNAKAIRSHSIALADKIEREMRHKAFPLVVGGDCSILLGAGLATSRLGGRGLVFLDGHTDFYLPEQSATGGCAGMDLALATGWGPGELTNIEGRSAYFKPATVALLGNRDFEPRPAAAAIPPPGEAFGCYLPLDAARRLGIEQAARQAVAAASRDGNGYWVHLDVDVLDSQSMPAVDSPQAGGFTFSELKMLLEFVLFSGKACGMQMTVYDPDRDPGGRAGSRLIEMMGALFNSRQSSASCPTS